MANRKEKSDRLIELNSHIQNPSASQLSQSRPQDNHQKQSKNNQNLLQKQQLDLDGYELEKQQQQDELKEEEDVVNQEEDFVSDQDDDEDEEEDDDEESLEGLNIDKDEDLQSLLTELNDTAIQALKNEDNENALECLKRGEQLLEAVTAEGKDVDRNLIIVILYNLACCYQRMNMLEDGASYLDGTIYNLEAKVTNFDDNESIIQMMLQNGGNANAPGIQGLIQSSQHSLNSNNSGGFNQFNIPTAIETTKKFNISSKLFKLRYMCKCHLQLCAVLSQINKHQEALYHGQMASFFCQELIKNTLILCKSYIAKLLQEKQSKTSKNILKDIENEVNEVGMLEKNNSNNSMNGGGNDMQDKDQIGRRMSYYVEENEKILNLLITNCEPILSEIVNLVNHFNSYNKIQKVVEKHGIIIEDISILKDCQNKGGNIINPQKLLNNAQTNINNQPIGNSNGGGGVPNTTHCNYNKLKNTYITQIKQPPKPLQNKRTSNTDDVVPEELEKKKKVQLNESTYYNTRGQDGQSSTYFSQLKNNVKTILGVKEQDDWIFNLNIGNVMHLLPMSLEELNLHIDNSHELSRDAMLEKIILLSVSYFCVGTELRFLSSSSPSQPVINKDQKQNKNVYGEVPNPDQKYTKADSEMWHAMALEACGTFLPSECPLVSHIIMSYQKHHSPAMTSIPEDSVLEEELKVVRPLNEIKNDSINYHQIIRAYNQFPKKSVSALGVPHQKQLPARPMTSQQVSKNNQMFQNNMNNLMIMNAQNTSGLTKGESKIKIKKKGVGQPEIEVDLVEPPDDSSSLQMMHISQSAKKSSKNAKGIIVDSPDKQYLQQEIYQQQQLQQQHQKQQELIQQQLYIQQQQQFQQQVQQQQQIKMQHTQNLNHLVSKPPISQNHHHKMGGASNNQQQQQFNNQNSRNYIQGVEDNMSKRPKTSKQNKVMGINQRLIQTMSNNMKPKIEVDLKQSKLANNNSNINKSGRMSSAGSLSQKRKSVSSQRSKASTGKSHQQTAGAGTVTVTNQLQLQQQQQILIGSKYHQIPNSVNINSNSSSQARKHKKLTSQRVQNESSGSQNFQKIIDYQKQKMISGGGVKSSRPTVKTPTAASQMLSYQNPTNFPLQNNYMSVQTTPSHMDLKTINYFPLPPSQQQQQQPSSQLIYNKLQQQSQQFGWENSKKQNQQQQLPSQQMTLEEKIQASNKSKIKLLKQKNINY